MRILAFFFICCLASHAVNAQKSLQFNTVDSLFRYAEEHAAGIRSGDQQSLLATSTKLAALANTVNLRSPLSASWTDNTELPVNYVPGEIFGGPPGSVKELAFGQQYVSSYSITPQLDIINPSAWARVKSAAINVQLTETTNLITKKSLFENIAATYFNILSLQEQVQALQLNVSAADSIALVTKNKLEQGIIREQDKNNAAINLLNIQDKAAQVQLTLAQQYNTLKLLCDIPESTTLLITGGNAAEAPAVAPTAKGAALIEKQQQLQSAYLRSELRSSRLLSFSPTVSFIFNQAWQESSNKQFFDPDANRFSTQYFGLKLSVPFPFDATRLSQNYAAKVSYRIATINATHAGLQDQLNNEQLDLGYSIALSAYNTGKQVNELKEMNYRKSINQYNEGILSTENLLLSFTDRVNAQLSLIAAGASLRYAAEKIKISNTIQ